MVAYLWQNSTIDVHVLSTLIEIHSKSGCLIFNNNILLFSTNILDKCESITAHIYINVNRLRFTFIFNDSPLHSKIHIYIQRFTFKFNA